MLLLGTKKCYYTRMTTGPRQQRRARRTTRSVYTRYATIVAALAVIIIGIYVSTSREPQQEEIAGATSNSLARLYDEAQEDAENKKWGTAGSKFRQIANIKPNYRDSEEQAEEIAESLYEEAIEHIKNEDYEEAQEALNDAEAADPANNKVQDKLDEVNKIIDEQNDDPVSSNETTDSGNQGEGDANGNGGGSGDGDEAALAIPDDATPVSLLPDSAAGYRIVRNGWLSEPMEAGATWLPESSEMRRDINQVLLTITKYPQAAGADERLTREKDTFPKEPENTTINGHDAYSGLYNFSGSSDTYEDQQIATLTWTRDNWFFSVQILPKGTPDSAFKKGTARDVAIKIGY